MDISDIIGFFITLAAIFYMFFKRAKDLRNPSNADDMDEEQQQADKLKDFLKSLEIDMEESHDFKPPPKPQITKVAAKPLVREMSKPTPIYKKEEKGSFKSDLDDYQTKTNIDDRRLKINIKNRFEGNYGEHLISKEYRGEKVQKLVGNRKSSRVKNIIRSLPSKKDMVILTEVLNPPKGFKF